MERYKLDDELQDYSFFGSSDDGELARGWITKYLHQDKNAWIGLLHENSYTPDHMQRPHAATPIAHD